MAKAQGPRTRSEGSPTKLVTIPGKGGANEPKLLTGLKARVEQEKKRGPVTQDLLDSELVRAARLRDPRLRAAAPSFVRGEVSIVDDEAEASSKEKARVAGDQSAKPEGMQISEEQREAARGGKYIQPSRVGTRTIAGHFDADVAERLKDLARARRTTVQALLSEALGDLFEKHGADLERYEVAIRALRKD